MKEFEPGNNGMVATESIAIGDLIVFVPSEYFITYQYAKEQSHILKLLQ